VPDDERGSPDTILLSTVARIIRHGLENPFPAFARNARAIRQAVPFIANRDSAICTASTL
jgi:hypothetical protein